MLQLKGTLNIIDNSGGVIAQCIKVIKAGRYASVGDEIVIVVRKARPISSTSLAGTKVKKGDVKHALVVRTKKEFMRPDGRFIRFDDNACVLMNNKKEPFGTRILGPVANELRQKGWAKFVSLAPRVV